MQKIIIVLICCGAVMGFSSFSFANWTDNDTPENRAIVKAKFEEIRAEILTLEDHPWAGLYYQGDGLGTNLNLAVAPKAGFAFAGRGCVGLSGQNYGEITEKDGHLIFSFALKNEEYMTSGIPEKFLPVPWGERMYLIPQGEIIKKGGIDLVPPNPLRRHRYSNIHLQYPPVLSVLLQANVQQVS